MAFSKEIKSNYLDFLFDLYTQGVELSQEKMMQLNDAGYLNEPDVPRRSSGNENHKAFIKEMMVKKDNEADADEMIDIVEEIEDGGESSVHIIGEEAYDEEKKAYKYEGREYIKKEDWMPRDRLLHEKDFVEWIDSMNFFGFQNRKEYKKLNLYIQQANDWFAENDYESNYFYQEDKEVFHDREIERCVENTLYFINKYGMLKEGDASAGLRRYSAKPAHEVMAYLVDCGYSFMMGKPRQIAATSTIGLIAVKKLILNKNFFIKFVTQDKETGVEIFEDKIKFPFGELPDFLRPEASNDRDNLLKLGRKEDKGVTGGVNSRLLVVAPSVSAINGGSPQLVLVDEIGYINILSRMLKESRPTMFWQNPDTGKLEMKRQLIAFGTGGEASASGGKAFEREFMSLVDAWKKRDFSSGIIPVFFDWTTRPGVTPGDYESEKKVYYGVEGPEGEAQRIQFHQHFPSKIQDMFLTMAKTLVGADYIENNLQRILKANHLVRTQRGYFEPVFDVTKPAEEHSDVPFAIIGATWVPTEDFDKRATTIMFQEPKRGWKNRYFQGTDPIASDTGQSNMSSAIWDKHFCTVSAVVDYRENNYQYVFLQCLLLGMYYETNPDRRSVKELLETNIGLAYREYKTNKGLFNSLVFNTELPDALQTGSGNIVGIDNRGARNKIIVGRMFEMMQAYGDRIYVEEFFLQLKTFVCTVNDKGNETWGPIDRRYYKDDILFSVVFAYICAQCFPYLTPAENAGNIREMETRYELVYDKNYNLSRIPVRRPV